MVCCQRQRSRILRRDCRPICMSIYIGPWQNITKGLNVELYPGYLKLALYVSQFIQE